MKNYFFLFSVIVFLTTCSNNKQKAVIKGDIPNLPDGIMYLYKNSFAEVIDSVQTRNGKFKIIYQYDQPNYIGIRHVDKKGIKTLFSYRTYAEYKKSPFSVDTFMSDSLIIISGNMKEYQPVGGMNFDKNIRLVNAPPLKMGKQTKAYYSIDLDFFDKADTKSLKDKICQYPYSYHLLYKLEKNKNKYSASQMKEFFQLFEKDVKKSDTYKKLMTYAEKKEKAKLKTPLLEDINGEKVTFIDPKYDKQLIVFWASWCGPCREEIPFLKKAYESKGSKLEFISISIDKDKAAWKKALEKEQMPWKQFVVNDKEEAYEDLQILFKFNNAIPYTVLVDSNLKILVSSTGLSSEEQLKDILGK
ncbi:thioredoxin-like domain-containing protein [Elizabethkingia anophelis]|uniref:thioredoxin-like domain-containing protein n=1 Tax=Elizabethkingia anophelis TaxID=1117645 RepID=UPI00389233E0